MRTFFALPCGCGRTLSVSARNIEGPFLNFFCYHCGLVTRHELDKMTAIDAALNCNAEPELVRIVLRCSAPGCKSHAIVYALKEQPLKSESEWTFSGVLCGEGHSLTRAVRVPEDGIP